MKHSSTLKNFIASFLSRPIPEPETVKSFHEKMIKKKNAPENNHEIWRSCNSCANQWDAILEGYDICPKCGSTDLISGKLL